MPKGHIAVDLRWVNKNTQLFYSIAYQAEELRPLRKGMGFKFRASNGWMLVASYSPAMGVDVKCKCCWVMGRLDNEDEVETEVRPQHGLGASELMFVAQEIEQAFSEASKGEWEEYVIIPE